MYGIAFMQKGMIFCRSLSDVDVELKTVEKRRRANEKVVEVEEYNKRNPVRRIVDPSSMMVDITIILLSLYQLYRRKFPAEDEEDIQDLGTLGTCLNIAHIMKLLIYDTYFTYMFKNIVFVFQIFEEMCGAVS